MSPEVATGLIVSDVLVTLEGTTGDPAKDDQLRRQIGELVAGLQGVPFQQFVADGVLGQVRRLPLVTSARFALHESVPAGQVVVAVAAGAAEAVPPPAPEGTMATGNVADLPLLYQDGRSLLKVIFNGGMGAYSVSNPLFGHADKFTKGNLAAKHPAGSGNTTWGEMYIEPGLGGIARLGETPVYGYGAATYLVSASSGQDLYDSGNRSYGDFEQLYAGFIYDVPGKGNALNVSAGRQIYQLRQGFLISKIPGSTNIGSRGALWLGPRLAYDKTAIADLKLGDFRLEGIALEPTEYSGMETDTRITGGTLTYRDGKSVDAAFTYLYAPSSDRAYRGPDGSVLGTREGLQTFSPSLWLTSPFGLEGLWFKGEYAYQSHADIDMSANGYALWLGYEAAGLPWKPGISYRYTHFSGDDPGTASFERYDPLFSGGQNNYTPGMLLSSVLTNANLETHKLTLTAKPSGTTALTLEYSIHRADEYNNVGAIGPMQSLQSKDLAQELDLFFNMFLGKNYYLQVLLAGAFPGEAVEEGVGGDAENWLAAQVSLYWFF